MLSSITPLGERSKNNSWAVTATAYIAGSTLGGVALGLLLSPLAYLADRLTARTALAVLGVALLAAAALDAGGVALPTLRRQVNENWLSAYRGWVYGAGFGLQLGFALVTIITSWAVWATVAAVVLVGAGGTEPWGAAVIVGATFGLFRGLVLLTARGATDPAGLAALHRRIATGARASANATRILLLVLGVVSLGSALFLEVTA